MNKTVNINLAGIFFHIDEDAYLKLQRYLDAIKRSFTDPEGRSEIIADIEARIAELFNQRVQNHKQVIQIKEVDEIIAIMGQPEDYLVDDEIFQDEPRTNQNTKSVSSKKLFRDTDNSYIGGVASGLGHYLGIDSIWMRLIWLLLAFASGGTFIIIYILFWVLVPEAKTTAEKIMMTGDPVNISNIEKKIKNGFDNVSKTVSETVKNVDLPKQGQRIKSTSKSFFETLGEVIMFFLKIFAKFVGVILIAIGASVLIALIITLFYMGVFGIVQIKGLGLVELMNSANVPVWLISIFAFFSIAIPFFFLFYLGLKILINNLKSIGNIAKFTLLGVWLISIIGLAVIGIRQASEHVFDESIVDKEELLIMASDTIHLKMAGNDLYRNPINKHGNDFKVVHNENGEKTIYSSDITIIVKSTTDSIASLSINKSADGSDYNKAIERAKNINYNYALKDHVLLLDSYFTTNSKNKYSDQEVVLTLYLPEGTIIKCSDNSKTFFYYNKYQGTIITYNDVNHFLKILDNDIECLDCPIEEDFEVDVDVKDENNTIKINKNGLEIKADDAEIIINSSGVKAKTEDVNIDINSDSLNIKSSNH
jgi:phage shock protein PspC (stress-responsive transcriptional regulator)